MSRPVPNMEGGSIETWKTNTEDQEEDTWTVNIWFSDEPQDQTLKVLEQP